MWGHDEALLLMRQLIVSNRYTGWEQCCLMRQSNGQCVMWGHDEAPLSKIYAVILSLLRCEQWWRKRESGQLFH